MSLNREPGPTVAGCPKPFGHQRFPANHGANSQYVKENNVHQPSDVISRYFERDADRDIDSIVSLFTADATVIDEGEERRGTAEIRAWQTGAASKYTADLKWEFTIESQHITRLTIAP
jgi:hypothetical protein